MAVRLTVVEILRSGPKWWTDTVIAVPRATLIVWLKSGQLIENACTDAGLWGKLDKT